jgi:glycerol-3-phosphate acyltransferase PlsY
MATLHLFLILFLSYLAGSFPSSIVIGKLFFKTDIREHGSGNAGGTNAVRVFGWPAGTAVILIDIAKGACAVLFIARLPLFGTADVPLLPSDAAALLAGITAVAGHIWTVFASFRGGKGVATAAGMVAALYPFGFAGALLFFVLGVAVTGTVSVGSLAAAVSFPAVLVVAEHIGIASTSPLLTWVSIPSALLIIFTHRGNIARLLRGEERRMFGRK